MNSMIDFENVLHVERSSKYIFAVERQKEMEIVDMSVIMKPVENGKSDQSHHNHRICVCAWFGWSLVDGFYWSNGKHDYANAGHNGVIDSV